MGIKGRIAAIISIAIIVVFAIELKDNIAQAKLSCPTVEVLNISDYKWNGYDEQVKKLAQVRCGFKYRNSPCLVKFVKRGLKDYHVICGAKRGADGDDQLDR